MTIRTLSPRCLVDSSSALESPAVAEAANALRAAAPPIDAPSASQWTSEARRLAALAEAEAVGREDPRFAALFAELDLDGPTAKAVAAGLLARTEEPADAESVAAQLRQLADRIERAVRLPLEAELIEIFAPADGERNAEILIGYYGWKDGRQHTLTEIGRRFGITRERIRQVCVKQTKKPRGVKAIFAPAMDRALAAIHARLPCAAAELEEELAQRGWTAVGLRLEAVAAGAKLLERRVDFQVIEIGSEKQGRPRLAVRAEQVNTVLSIVDAAKKEVYFHGLATIDEIQRGVAARFPGGVARELVAEALQLVDGFTWLDAATGWFRIEGIGRHGLPKTIDKVLAVAGEVRVAELRAAMARNRRLWKAPPPQNVLVEFCRHLPGVCCEGERIWSEAPRDWREALTGVERKLVSVLKRHGPVLERGDMEDICVRDGMNRFSFHAFVSWSPVIVQLGHSVYGLLGTRVPRQKLDALAKARRSTRMSRRVLAGHGWTEDGKVWLSYRLSKAASTYAVITVPAALKTHVRGRFALLDPDGREIGTLATKDGRAWGLGAFLRQSGARIDDCILLTLDLHNRTAAVAWSEGLPPEDGQK